MSGTSGPSKSGEHSTPYSKNVSAASQANTSATIDEVDPYIINDMKNDLSVPFDKFLLGLGADRKAVLDKNDAFIKGLSRDQFISRKLKEYGEKHKETALYGPFCELANYVISKLDNGKIVFSRNDPNCINGPRGNSRKPDVVALDKDNASVANGKWKDYNTSGPTGVKWTWSDFWYIAEFKYSKSAQPNELESEPIVESEVGGGAESSPKSKTKGDVPVPGDSLGDKETRNRSEQQSSSTARKRLKQQDVDPEDGSRKRRKGDANPTQDLRKQGARYCIDMLSDVPNRRHCLQLLIANSSLFMAYYDRAGSVTSDRLDFGKEESWYLLIVLIKTLAEMSCVDCGWLDEMKAFSVQDIDGLPDEDVKALVTAVQQDPKAWREPRAPLAIAQMSEGQKAKSSSASSVIGRGGSDGGRQYDRADAFMEEPEKSLPGPEGGGARSIDELKKNLESLPKKPKWTLKMKSHVLYLLYQVDHKPAVYGWVSRGMRVFLSYAPTLDKYQTRPYVVKMSWLHGRRHPEANILGEARQVLRKLDNDPRIRAVYGNRKLEDCLPKVFLSDKLGDLLEEGSFRQRVLGETFRPQNRIWHCLVSEYLMPLYKMTEISDFKEAVRGMVLGHHFLATSYKRILHRDISLGNLMVRVGNGVICGVLNDWDLAEMEPRTNDDHSGERTGTRPYMAIDLLVPLPPRHLERFDWESFFYVICMIACRYDRGEDKNSNALSDWYDPKDTGLRRTKYALLTGFEGIKNDVTDFYRQVVSDWTEPLRKLFANGYLARIRHEDSPSTPFTGEVLFDNETLGGHVTWEKVLEILQR